jgi:organic radical activating enzyme
LVKAPERTGILGSLARRLPQVKGRGIFNPTTTTFNFTNKCNAKCIQCLEKANEKGFEPFTVKEAADVFRQIVKLKQGNASDYLHLWGGEPFLDLGLLYGIAQEAGGLGYKRIEIATNGYWGKDVPQARQILKNLLKCVIPAELMIQLSIDNFHQVQRILDPVYLANLIFLIKTEFPSIRVTINSLALNDNQSLHDVANAVSAIELQKGISALFDENNFNSFTFYQGSHPRTIPLNFFTLSLSGKCTSRLSPYFGTRPLDPSVITENEYSPKHHIAIGINRQMYVNMHFGSPEILPMGSLGEYSINQLIKRVEADPIAVSLLRHGYSEIYPHLQELFDFDSWIRQFHLGYDVLKGLEVDAPFSQQI